MYTRTIALLALLCTIATGLPVESSDGETRQFNYRLPNDTVPIHYDLKLIPDISEAFSFDGQVAIKVKILQPTEEIKLHTVELILDENATRLFDENNNAFTPKWYSYNNQTEISTMYFGGPLQVGVYILSLQFSGIIHDDLFGFFKSSYVDGKRNEVWLAATQFEPTYARKVFPCWDEPALKATFDISIKHYPDYTAISNMPIREKSKIDETGKIWTHFESTPVMSTYLVAFVIANFAKISNADGTINVWSREDMVPHLELAREVAQKAQKELEHYTNSTIRVPKMDHVILPQHPTDAMENWGIITYSESTFLYVKDEISMLQKYLVYETVIHELAHQWFGNLVSPSWWSQVWLTEGFASYLEDYILNKICKGCRAVEYFVVSVVQESLSIDTQLFATPIETNIETPTESRKIFTNVLYQKAPSILHMLSNIITPEVFQSGTIKFLNTHEYDSANSDNLWEALQSTLDKSDVPHGDFQVKQVMDFWIKRKRYPLVYVNRNYSTGTVTITQKDFGLVDVHENNDTDNYEDKNEEYEWWVPINYATKGNPDFSDTRPTHWLKPQKNLIIDGINPDDWVIINKQQSGYYRVTYDEVNWKRISAYLKSENFTDIHVLNRAQIISDVTSLSYYKHIDPLIFLDVITYLCQETDYIPWYPMFSFIRYIKSTLDVPSASRIKEFVLDIMDNLIKDVGFDEHRDEEPLDKIKRSQTLQIACDLGHLGCRQIAAVKFMENYKNPKTNKISPDLKLWINMNGMKLLNESDWNMVFESCMKNPSKEVLCALSTTSNPALLEKYLHAAISNDTNISEEYRTIMLTEGLDISRLTPPLADVVINVFTEHWDEVIKRSQYAIYDMRDIFFNIYSEDQVTKAKEFCQIVSDEKCMSPKFWEIRMKRINSYEDRVNQWLQLLNNRVDVLFPKTCFTNVANAL
ncbi:PREDICTED: aminopeptidase N-like [Eufriesea mexicana]|uniref:aminopeptidase N-like n=1 Tax=Eufriesea mexicana TaxID=516756 RepID=UPI00083C31B5|nr:PREDICTED: aminopeptidase N-like [Eufriesea mexicana]